MWERCEVCQSKEAKGVKLIFGTEIEMCLKHRREIDKDIVNLKEFQEYVARRALYDSYQRLNSVDLDNYLMMTKELVELSTFLMDYVEGWIKSRQLVTDVEVPQEKQE